MICVIADQTFDQLMIVRICFLSILFIGIKSFTWPHFIGKMPRLFSFRLIFFRSSVKQIEGTCSFTLHKDVFQVLSFRTGHSTDTCLFTICERFGTFISDLFS